MQSPSENDSDGTDGRYLAMPGDYDLLLLDVMLPDMDGWQVVQSPRAAEQAVPVLFSTARNGVVDRVEGLEMGTGGYLMKPFASAELLARAHTLLHWGAGVVSSGRIQVADPVLDSAHRRVPCGDQEIPLTSKEFPLLKLLVCRRGEVLPRSLIALQVWDMDSNSDTNTIDVAIRRLYAKIGDHFGSKLIRAVRGMDYALETPEDAT